MVCNFTWCYVWLCQCCVLFDISYVGVHITLYQIVPSHPRPWRKSWGGAAGRATWCRHTTVWYSITWYGEVFPCMAWCSDGADLEEYHCGRCFAFACDIARGEDPRPVIWRRAALDDIVLLHSDAHWIVCLRLSVMKFQLLECSHAVLSQHCALNHIVLDCLKLPNVSQVRMHYLNICIDHYIYTTCSCPCFGAHVLEVLVLVFMFLNRILLSRVCVIHTQTAKFPFAMKLWQEWWGNGMHLSQKNV